MMNDGASKIVGSVLMSLHESLPRKELFGGAGSLKNVHHIGIFDPTLYGILDLQSILRPFIYCKLIVPCSLAL
jgi:hypothetical protein